MPVDAGAAGPQGRPPTPAGNPPRPPFIRASGVALGMAALYALGLLVK